MSNSTLNEALGDWSHHIRLLGNSGAHPGDDGLETVSAQEAEEVLAFLDELLKWTYVMPDRLMKARLRTAPPESQP